MTVTARRSLATALLAAALMVAGTNLIVGGRARGPSGPTAEYAAAYNTVAAALTLPDIDRMTLPQQHAAIASFAASLAAIAIPDSLRPQADALKVATARLLDTWTVAHFTGKPLPGGADPSTVPLAAAQVWYADAAALGESLGLSSTDAVVYPTRPPQPACTAALLTLKADLYPTYYEAPGVLVLALGISRQVYCHIDAAVTVSLVDGLGQPLAVAGNPYHNRLVIPVVYTEEYGTGFSLAWRNWCGVAGDYSIRVQVAGLTKVLSLQGVALPTCRDRGEPSTLGSQ